MLGGFDGLHLGHRALLTAAKQTGLPVCLTTMLGGKGRVLFTRQEREDIFTRAGVNCLLELVFTEQLKNTGAELFLQKLFTEFEAKHIFCGEDFRFGKDALGTPELLQESAPCAVHILKHYEKDGKKVSVSRIKELVKEGNLSAANSFLGERYFIQGIVEHGRRIGRRYGFPTLNLSAPEEKLLPPDGVYAGIAETPKGIYKTILNIGARPTFGVEERKIESYLEGFEGDLYDAEVKVYPIEFLRPVSQFSSPEALKEQLEKDKRSIL